VNPPRKKEEVSVTVNPSLQRKDVISAKEFEGTLERADSIEYVQEYYRLRDKAIVCIFKLTGKRRGEVASLEVDDLEVKNGTLSITFTLEKKRRKSLILRRAEKQISLSDPLTKPIIDYWHFLKQNHPSCLYLFPRTFYSGLTGALVFKYKYHLGGRQILRVVKKLNPESWCHLYRETAGAEIVRQDQSIMAAFKVMLRLDLEDERTALGYVRRYAVDLISRGVSDEQKQIISSIIASAELTEKQRRVLLNVLSRL